MGNRDINLAIVGPYPNLFTYKARSGQLDSLKPGTRFLVPFGKSDRIGFYVNDQNRPVDYRLRYVKERIDLSSPFPPYLFEFCRWVSQYYMAGLGETLAAALPGTESKRPRLEYSPINIEQFQDISFASEAEQIIARRLIRYGSVKEEFIRTDRAYLPVIQEWINRGLITTHYRGKKSRPKLMGYRLKTDSRTEIDSDEKLKPLHSGMIYSRRELLENFGLSDYMINKLNNNNIFEKVFDSGRITEISNYPIRYGLDHLDLLDGQKKVLDRINHAIEAKKFAPFMLFGITGSGKTLVYCHAARQIINKGGSVLVLVPEIALSGLLLSSFAAFFGDSVAVMHSGLSVSERLTVREKIASGQIKVVIGARSAIFSPMKNLGLVIVDEEHDPSYKQDDPAPRYHGRDAAVMLARQLNIPIVLGSASPSLESFYNAKAGKYELLTLDQRPKSGYRMPEIVTLNMKREKISGDCSFMSFRLKKETERHLEGGGQVIYYLNRRGFAPRLKCRDCGEVPTCEACGITMTYHRAGNSLKCHFCDRVEEAPDKCPACGSISFNYIGAGTQRVEESLSRLFSHIKAERIDSDKAATKSGRVILSDFAEEKFDLLIGTQMVTKGLDIPGVTLVGVLSADIGLDMPDFRAAEKTYARLLQVAGRAGRGERDGQVLIQTYYDDHPVIAHLADGDYPAFYDFVIKDRQTLAYPPFSRLISITLSSPDEKLLEKETLAFRFKIEEKLSGISGTVKNDGQLKREIDTGAKSQFQLLGPSKAPLYKLRGNFRRRIMIKCKSISKVVDRFRDWQIQNGNFDLPSKIKITIDIDPVNMM